MALTKQKKTQKVATLAGELQTATAAIIGTFTAMTADKDFDLRKTVRGAGGKYHVLKNKLAPKAGAGTQVEGALGGLK
ncbi:MAG: 50S ribosomal protein L10, partial [Janthinobacterium lividum]